MDLLLVLQTFRVSMKIVFSRCFHGVFDHIEVKAAFIEAAFSLSGLAQKCLQMAHNKLASEQASNKKVDHVLLKKVLIGAGFLGAIFLSAIEAVVRCWIVPPVPLTIRQFKLHEGEKIVLRHVTILYTIYNIGQSAVSLYSHCFYSEKEIDYELQANTYLFAGKSETSNGDRSTFFYNASTLLRKEFTPVSH